MTTQLLLAVDLLLVVTGAAGFLTAGAVALVGVGESVRPGQGRGRTVAVAAAGVAGLLLCLARVAVDALLVGRGWWFAGEKIALGLPLAVLSAGLGAAVGLPFAVRAVRGRAREERRPAAAASLLIAGYGSAAGLLLTFVVGYPMSVAGAGAVAALVVGVSALTWVVLTRSGSPGVRAFLVLVCVIPVLAAAGLAFYRSVQPVAIGGGTAGHAHLAAAAASAGGATPTTGQTVSVRDLRTPVDSPGPVRRFTLAARQEALTLPSGRVLEAWTFGSVPGPELRVRQGDVVEVTLQNRDIADGVTLHWHGYPVPNGEDGVAGVTQDAVAPGESFVYRFVARDSGTYWYHAHQVSSEAVRRGLYGVLVVEPAGAVVGGGDAAAEGTSEGRLVDESVTDGVADIVVPVHTFDGVPVVAGTDGPLDASVEPGQPVRLRLINTDPTPHRISVGGSDLTVVAVDGTDLIDPTPLRGTVLRIPAGGRYDVAFEMPSSTVDVAVEGAPDTGVRLAPGSGGASSGGGVPFVDGPELDLLSYGTPAPVPGITDRAGVTAVDREATLVLDRQARFLDGIPTLAQTVNGDVHPFVPPIAVREGDLVRLTVVNRGGDTHPMHPHGHRVLVESRDGMPVTGSPLWFDTFDVRPGEVWTVLLRADNPGIWMAHCHNLEHATQGMVVHLTYEGVSTPFSLGGGPADNRPE